MIAKILVPLDGSTLAERALPLAIEIASENNAELILYRVVPHFPLPAVDPLLYEEMNRMGEDEALAYLRQIRNGLGDAVMADVVCEFGPAAESVLRYTAENDVDLIVISSHGRSGLNRWVYGSVAERIMSQAPCPTLITNARHEQVEGAPKKILVPLDGSDLAEKALSSAVDLSKVFGAELHLLRVTPSGDMRLQTEAMAQVFAEMADDEIEGARTYLQEMAENVGVEDVQISVRPAKGSVAETIIDYAAEHEINQIVMSSHGRTGLQRWVYGSVAEKVLRSACCATMIVRNK